MKRRCTALIFFLFFFSCAIAQQIIFDGRIRCALDDKALSTRGAENVVIVPTAFPGYATITTSSPPGYFAITTTYSKKELLDHNLRVYVITNCKSCKQQTFSVFISEDQLQKVPGGYRISLGTRFIAKKCEFIELPALEADKIAGKLQKQEMNDEHVPAWVPAPSLLNLLATVTFAAAPRPPDSSSSKIVPIKVRDRQKSQPGRFLLNSAFVNSSNAGFNFSPLRDYSEAVLWNPSSLSFASASGGVGISTDWIDRVKITGFIKYGSRFSTGVGLIYAAQGELRQVIGGDTTNNVKFKTHEMAIYWANTIRLSNKLSLGVTTKFVDQRLSNPNSERITYYYKTNKPFPPQIVSTTYELLDTASKNQSIDLDISTTYAVSKNWQIGLIFMNLLNSKLQTSYQVDNSRKEYLGQFAAGFGVAYRYKRVNLGADLIYHNGQLYNVSLGINAVLLNRTLLQLAYSTKTGQPSVTCTYGHFKLAYLNSDGYYSGPHGNAYLFGGYSYNW